jgi:heme exporter protein C
MPPRVRLPDAAMNKTFTPLLLLAMVLFAVAPLMVANAPTEMTMGLIQRVFYYHVPSAAAMFLSTFVCGIASAVFLFKRRRAADRIAVSAAELAVVFGAIVMVTGPLWARKAWGVWWQWDARLTSVLLLWMIFIAYLLVRRYGGPGSDKLSAAMAIFGMANVPFVYVSVNWWRTIHPNTNVVRSLAPGMRGPFWFCMASFALLFFLILWVRVRLENQRARVEDLYLALDE